MSEQSTEKGLDKPKPPPPTRAQRLAAFGFLGAFGLTIITVLLTGLSVGAPAARHVLLPLPPAADTHLPSPRAEAPSDSPSVAPPTPAAPTSSVGEPSSNESAADQDAERDSDGKTHKDARKDARESRGDDPR